AAAVLQGIEIDIVTYDKTSGLPLRAARGCSYASGEIEVQAQQIIITSAVFMARTVKGTGL
ncbi:MAG TPA: hypothetical protein VNX47_05955, partial [Nevskia sp.]|nr:hypothetical protein [Nevskia sp.]